MFTNGTRPIRVAATVFGLVVIGVSGVCYTQENGVGMGEYYARCESCHGLTGKGDGYFAKELTTRVPDLTTIAKRNNGVFNFERVYEFIDGRQIRRAHGGEMPLWGDFYKVEAEEYFIPYSESSEALLDARIRALTQYVYSLQAK